MVKEIERGTELAMFNDPDAAGLCGLTAGAAAGAAIGACWATGWTVTCRRRPNFDPPCRLNFDPGMEAGIVDADCV